MAGANIVAIGTSLFTNPNLVLDIKRDLLAYYVEQNLQHLSDIAGIAHQKDK